MTERIIQKICPKCEGEYQRDDFGKCEYCRKVICIDCMPIHHGQRHFHPFSISKKDFEKLEEDVYCYQNKEEQNFIE